MISIRMRKRAKVDGKYPVVMIIQKNNRTKLISLGVFIRENEWKDGRINKKNKEYVRLNKLLDTKRQKAHRIIDEFAIDDIDWTLEQFEEQFRGVESSSVTVSHFWLEKIADLEEAGRFGNAKAYEDTYRSFFKFYKDKGLKFPNLDVRLLHKYEIHLRSRGNNDGGIGLKMREIRALFNDAINKGITKQQYYPFKKYKLSKFKSSGTKQALSKDEIRKFEKLDLENSPHLINAYNYFLFSYYARGMNFRDMMTLKWSDTSGNRIVYNRAKTKTRFTIEINEPMLEILKYYKENNHNSKYVFPIIVNEKMTPKQFSNRKHKVLKRYNKRLKEIAEKQKIDKNITSYVARHSFATNLKFSGISTDKISQLMGHSDIKVTQAYLKDFGDEELDKAVNVLLKEADVTYGVW